jgi:hypothetical protein
VSNYRVTGSITGGARSPSDITLRENLFDMLSVLDANIPSSPLVQLLIMVAAMSISLVYARLATLRVQVQSRPQPVLYRPTRNILLFVGVVYIGVIFLLRMYRSFDMLDVRLLAPALAVLWLLMLVVLAQMKPVKIMHLVAQILIWFCVIVLPVKGYIRFQDSIYSWHVLGSPNHPANAGVSYMNYTYMRQVNPAKEMVAGLLSGDAVVVTERPLIFEFMSGKRSLQLPETIDIDVIKRFNALPTGSLVLLPNDKQQKGLLKLRLENNLIYEYLNLGHRIAVRTPIFVVPED